MNDSTSVSVNRAKTYQLVLFPLNNGATNVYYVLVLSYIATFGSRVLALSMLFASMMGSVMASNRRIPVTITEANSILSASTLLPKVAM